ncbi:hypothetical protein BDP27DRAFT_1430354 [Rhodocollybia butyracea]|uniref:Uncharacterized protein n=1 Tax=Rhodocollybia butyracea TaxID=206335 RepID=A0A9P5P8H2_9AGAR|nr:hypothetical protein BDP27DRAFT_1430354 [Rhodocollybia butyracea]
MVYVSTAKVKALKSRAHSTTFNPRNIESDWYPCWNQVLMDITMHLPNICVYGQHLLWIRSSREVLDPFLRQFMLQHHPAAAPPVAQDHEEELDSPMALDGDTSFGSAESVAGSDKDLKPDFSLMHLTLKPLRDDLAELPFGIRRAGMKVLHECYFCICEIKAAPSRRLAGTPNFEIVLRQRFRQAQDQLAKYANLYFLADGGLERDRLLLWACVGSHWVWAEVKRKHVPLWLWDTNSYAQGVDVEAFYRLFSLQPLDLCTPESDEEIDTLMAEYFQTLWIHPELYGEHVDTSEEESDGDEH